MKLTRRELLVGGTAGVAAFALGRGGLLASPPTSGGRFLVIVNLIGGNDGVSTVVPAHLAPYHERRPTLALQSTLDLDGVPFGLHPVLTGLQGCWQEGRLHVIHKVGYPDPNLSHFTSSDIYSLGVRDPTQSDGRGWLGRFADSYSVDPLGVVAVGVGRRPDFVAFQQSTLVLGNVASFNLQHDPDFIADHLLRVEHSRNILAREVPPADEPAATAFRASREAHELVERVQAGTAGWIDPGLYPSTSLGGYLKTVAQLESGVFGTQVYYTARGGFDTHAVQPYRHEQLLGELDGALTAFKTDLERTGRWDDCAILIISEFGRRNEENGSAGTDHGHGNAFLLVGGAVRGGMTGTLTEADLLADQPAMRYDFREIYSHLIERHLLLDPAPVFPEAFPATGELDLI
ncbi:MAG: DUF1501 domain-containing protein [Planctomycetota bacterium]